MRLKPQSGRGWQCRALRFQYQKGAIKTGPGPHRLPRGDRHFNTKKVRLKPAGRAIRLLRGSEFQYQKGAIKTERRVHLRFVKETFQYQKGAIKTSGGPTNTPPLKIFQYQKGAIKTFASPSPAFRQNNFNTKKVRLKPRRRWGSRTLSTTFQYQKGAIKTLTAAAAQVIAQAAPDFNTKKVRLKLQIAGWPDDLPVWNFNTKKVRLKPTPGRRWCFRVFEFQYQKGAIKTGATWVCL